MPQEECPDAFLDAVQQWVKDSKQQPELTQ
jgi:hypothetical protein